MVQGTMDAEVRNIERIAGELGHEGDA